MTLGPGRVDEAATDNTAGQNAAAALEGAAAQGGSLEEATLEGPAVEASAVETSDPDAIPAELAAKLKFDSNGLICAVIQDADNEDVLMVAWMNHTALARTLTTGRVWFWSRSRQGYWRKGDTSGHRQYVKSVHTDCDGDTLLVRVEQVGAACHTGTRTCFEAGGALPAEVGSAAADLAGAVAGVDAEGGAEAAMGAAEAEQTAVGVASSEDGTPVEGAGKRGEGAGTRAWAAVRRLLSGEGVAWILGAWVLTRVLLFSGASSVASENG